MKKELNKINKEIEINNKEFYETIYKDLVQAGLFKEGTTLNDY